MKIRNAHVTMAILAVALAPASAALAQAPAAGAQPPAIPGVCALSQTRAVAQSKVGQFVMKRLDTIGQQTNAELNGVKTGIDNDAKTIDSQRASLTREQLEQKALELQQRGNSLQRLAAQRQRELQLTEGKALDRIGNEMRPVLDLTRQERNCSVVLDADSALFVSPAMDITPAVIQKLDAKITEFAFDRERLDQQLAQPNQGAAATPAATAARPAAQPAKR